MPPSLLLCPGQRRSRRRQEAGAVLVIASLALVALLGCTALSVDVGWMVTATSHCQALADASALAAAGGPLIGYAAEAAQRVRAILDANAMVSLPSTCPTNEILLYDNGDTVPNYGRLGQDDEAITVPVHVTAQYRFGRALGLTEKEIVRSSTALRQISRLSGMGVLFALNSASNETAIDMTGNGAEIDGLAHSNSRVRIGGNGNRFTGVLEYRNRLTVTGNKHVFVQGTRVGTVQPDPFPWTIADFEPFDYEIFGNYNVPSSGVIPPGVYRVHGYVHISGSGQTADGVTFIADGDISFSGSNQLYTPARHNVFAWSLSTTDNGAVTISGARPGCYGTLYAPYGNADFSGSDLVITNSSIIAQTIDVSGNSFTVRPTPAVTQGDVLVKLIL